MPYEWERNLKRDMEPEKEPEEQNADFEQIRKEAKETARRLREKWKKEKAEAEKAKEKDG